jgi:antitoxin VapB
MDGRKLEKARLFKSNQSQAVRLPKPVALPDTVKEVQIISLGNARLIVPYGDAWNSWFDDEGVSDDFMQDREQPEPQQREEL